jgi:hypothetical protein
VAIGLMVIGVAVVIPCGMVAGGAAKNSLKIRAAWTAPGTVTAQLPSGQWEIYELTGTISGSSVGPVFYTHQTDGPVTIDSTDIQVTDPQGRAVPDRERFSPTSFQTYRTGSRIYTGVASFDVKSEGGYRITVATSESGHVILAKPPFADLGRSLKWILGAVTGAIVFVIGLVLLILDLDRRRRTTGPSTPAYSSAGPWGGPPPLSPEANQPAAPDHLWFAPIVNPGTSAGSAVPGWHPDPSGRNEYRYWNGAAWTEHVSTGGVTGFDPLQ